MGKDLEDLGVPWCEIFSQEQWYFFIKQILFWKPNMSTNQIVASLFGREAGSRVYLVLFSLRNFAEPRVSTGNSVETPSVIQLCCLISKQSNVQRGERISPKVIQEAAVLEWELQSLNFQFIHLFPPYPPYSAHSLPSIKYLPCANHHTRYFTFTISFNPYTYPLL